MARCQNEQNPVGQQHVARPQRRVQRRQLAHFMHVHAHQRELHDHPRDQVQQPEQLDRREVRSPASAPPAAATGLAAPACRACRHWLHLR